VLQTFSDLGAEILDVTVPDHEHIPLLQGMISTSEAATLHRAWLASRPGDYGPQVRARIEPGLATPATHYLSALQLRARIVERFVSEVFGRCDVLFAPVFTLVQPTIEETDVGDRPGFHKLLARLTRCTAPVNYLTCPSLALPGPLVKGLPSSFQLLGPPFGEGSLFEAGAAYEMATGFAERMPAGLD